MLIIKLNELIGNKINHWTILNAKHIKDKKGNTRIYVQCQCDCSNATIKWIRYDIIKRGESASCGCVAKQHIQELGKNKKAYNHYDFSKGFGIGYTQNNKIFYFDSTDYDKIKNYYWTIDKDGYVFTVLKNPNGTYKERILMHRLLLGLSKTDNRIADHINRTRYDNRKNNLRIADYSINNHNMNQQKNNNTGKKGVRKNNKVGYDAGLTYRGKHLRKHFKTLKEAIEQRKKWEFEYFGYYFDN